MRVEEFLKNKIIRQLKMNGRNFTFERYSEDKYHQRSDETTVIKSLVGLYHEGNTYIKANDAEGALLVKKNTPMILCLYEDGCEIDKGDIVIISDKKYSVVYKTNIQNFDIAFDISLEEFIYGK